jgi:glucan phosphoethanolaminetransferase (alkaline phosphatase superfamily)
MRKWGIVISVLYAVIVVGLLAPAGLRLAMSGSNAPFFRTLGDMYTSWLTWVPIVAVVAGQAVLLFLSVDTSQKRLKPRTHLAVSVIAGSMLFALLSYAAFSAAGAAAMGDKFLDRFWDTEAEIVAIWMAMWLVWGVVFYVYVRNSAQVITRAMSWLLKGSVLELLIAIPCHVIVRRRGDCSAPVATSFGIVTGIAVMLLSFGPSVLLLYKKRLDGYAARTSK